jgi:Phage integrase, N-terminal SAM-like domain
VRQYYEDWIKGKKPPLVRKSRERDYRQAFKKHILPFLGDTPVSQITPRKLEGFRIHLLEQAKLSLKSVRNIMDAYFGR